jgi:cysteine-rich repeat protein
MIHSREGSIPVIRGRRWFSMLFVAALALVFTPDAGAFSSFGNGNCSDCHSNVFAGGSDSAGHQAHLGLGLPDSCNTCHVSIGDNPSTSRCNQCHVGAGLRQHHRWASAHDCAPCHSNPEFPDPENTAVPGYANITAALDPCDGSEELFGPNVPFGAGSFTFSLDNDGDGLTDGDDDDCAPAAECGNGIVEGGEDCDDGNIADGDCCSATCQYEAADSFCDDGDFCTDGDACDGAGICVAGGARNCSDGVGCTVDSCDSVNATCVHTPDDSACADDGLFCNGEEFCDAVNDCASTGNPCDVGTVCNDANDTCDPEPACGNGVVEPGEECDGGPCCAADCTFAAAGSACDDGDFCTDGDACDGAGSCQAGGPTDCSDGVACTVDTCDSANDTCVHTPDDGFCDNGAFCDGVEICDPIDDCTSPGDPCPAGTMCDEATDACEPIAGCGDGVLQPGEECDDGNTADGDCCGADCQFEAAGSLCDDGQFCTVSEVCDGAGACGDGLPLDCGDGIACTDDACDEANATCVHTPNDANCDDDGLFCTGLEFCDPANDCSSTGDPCGAGTTCNEDLDSCDPSAEIVDLDIQRLKVNRRVRVGRRVRIALKVWNDGEVDGARPATVVGVQDGVEVYRETLDVSDPPEDGATRVRFPTYVPLAPGVITWTATLDDDDPDIDEATARTRVVARRVRPAEPAGGDDDHDEERDDDRR